MSLCFRLPIMAVIPLTLGMLLASGGEVEGAALPVADAGKPVAGRGQPTELFVATNGDDAWSGTLPEPNAERTDGPFATLARARDEIRICKGTQAPAGGFLVHVRGGQHYLAATFGLRKEDSGTQQSPIIYQAFEDEKPRLIGGRVVRDFQPYRDEILQADLSAQGLKDLTFTKQLFCEGKRQILARYPNFEPENPYAGGWAYADGEPIPMYQDIPGESRQLLTLKAEDLRPWARPTDGWVFVFPRYNWWNNWLQIESLDRRTRQVRLKGSASYPIRPNDRYYLYNLLEELDAPGEWYIDYDKHRLYFRPPEQGFRGEVVLPTLATVVQGNNLNHVTLRKLTIECCRGDAVQLRDSADCRVVGCTLRNTQDAGISISGGARCGVIGCDIYEVGTHGVSLQGGQQDTLTPGEHFAENNYIHHTGVYYKQGVGVSLRGVGNRASRNYIHDCPRFAVLYGGNDQIIELNHMRHLNLETCDTGATYSGGRDWLSPRGSVIRYNYIHDVFGFGKAQHHTGPWITPHYCWGIYLDDNSAEVEVYGNIVVRALRGLLHFHCARDNLVENNIFVDGMLQQIEMNGWNDYSRWIDRMGPNYEKYSKLPAWQKYEGLMRGGHPKDAIPMGGNRIRRNIIYYSAPEACLYKYRSTATRFLGDFQCDENLVWHQGAPLLIGGLKDVPEEKQWDTWREMGFDRNSVVADPLFVDPANDDYRLRPDSPALKLGFQPIPVEKIGPYQSADRASWPIVEAPGAREAGFRRAVPNVRSHVPER
ncbi:MAG: right-handed parallel beta-helix repeat-containing protein [Pirellulales bacterium]|nr:right-handed parallel beta-helix repeat-containing protein [Pirellulales bacterium]